MTGWGREHIHTLYTRFRVSKFSVYMPFLFLFYIPFFNLCFMLLTWSKGLDRIVEEAFALPYVLDWDIIIFMT